ncbi:MAG TPA: CRISPR-associated endonuclease Cas1, partial [Caldilineae bacterium]|nr:CRISPR-associated endonuclease Cas1 [Caldilineae bacterium]
MPIIQHLIVEEFGTFIRKHSGRLQVERLKTGEKLVQAPLIHLKQVLIASNGVSISADAVRACAEAGIPIHFISGTGTPYASLVSVGLVGTVQTRRAQMMAYND